MELRNLPSLFLSTLTLIFYLTNLCNSVAPGDLPQGCPTVSANQRALFDSCCYSSLLPDPWRTIDEDGDGRTWIASAAEDANCQQNVMVSNATDDWIITQYINTTLSSGESAREVEVNIQFTCTGDCSTSPTLLYHPTSTPSELPGIQLFTFVGPVNGSNMLTGITTSGFFLAIRATGDIFVTVNQISIVLTICREETVNLIRFPVAYSTANSIAGTCSADSESSSELLTGTCGSNGMWATSSSCVCSAGYFLQDDSCTACPLETYKSTAGNEMCSPCPQNSDATSVGSEICSCQPNYMRPNSNATEDCSGCQSGYFMMNGTCLVCPENSNNTQPSSNFCTCKGQSVTEDQLNTTTMERCSTCRENWKSVESFPLVCEMCPPRSERPVSQDVTGCSCTTGYEMKSSMCLARVIIPPETVIVKEGSIANPAEIALKLSANSYGFSVMLSNPPRNITFADGESQASFEIPGNDVALNNSYSLTVQVLSSDDYIGEGQFEVTIVDDDFVGISFLESQRKIFNESEDNILITLIKNATTAQDIQVNLALNPEGSSVSAENPTVTLEAGPPGNISVTLRIQQDSIGGESDEIVELALELVSPMNFSHMIDLSQLQITIKDDDVARETSPALTLPTTAPETSAVLTLPTIIGIAVAGAAILILIFLILLVSICICRFNASRQGFYITEENKTANPPSMLRYSASLRSISSQAVVPIIDGKGQLTEKENEFYV